MFFAISKISFEDEGTTNYDTRELRSLCEKIRFRFKVAVRPISDLEKSHSRLAIMIAALHPKEHELSQQLDHIMSFCEQSGFGRILDESTIFEDFDAFTTNESY